MKRSMIFAKSPKSMIIKIMRVPYDLSVKNKILTYEKMLKNNIEYPCVCDHCRIRVLHGSNNDVG